MPMVTRRTLSSHDTSVVWLGTYMVLLGEGHGQDRRGAFLLPCERYPRGRMTDSRSPCWQVCASACLLSKDPEHSPRHCLP